MGKSTLMAKKKQLKQQKKQLAVLASVTLLLIVAAVTTSAYASLEREIQCEMKDEVLDCLHIIDGEKLTLTFTNNAQETLHSVSVTAASQHCQVDEPTKRLGIDVGAGETFSVEYICSGGAVDDVDITVLYGNARQTRFARTGLLA